MPAEIDNEDDDRELVEGVPDWYDSIEEATTRLHASVVLYDGKPVYVTDVEQDRGRYGDKYIRVFFYTLPLERNPKKHRRVLSSPRFDFRPFKMGLLQQRDTNTLYYLQREPVRRYSQGLNDVNFTRRCINGPGRLRSVAEFVHLPEFAECVQGLGYSSLDTVRATQDPWNTTGHALSREFAALSEPNGSLSIFYARASVVVGRIAEKGIVLNPRYEYLSELLRKEIPNAC